MLKSLALVFRKPSYAGLLLLVTAIIILFAIWLPSLSLISYVMSSENFTFWGKIKFLAGSLGYLGTNFTWLTRWLTILIAFFSGINVALTVFFLRRRIAAERLAGMGMIGTLIGILGIGCTSCGSVILSSVIGLGAATSFIGFLPFRGIELGIIALIIISASIYLICQKIANPMKCKIN